MGAIEVSKKQRYHNQFIRCCPQKKNEIQTKKEKWQLAHPGKNAFAYHCCSCYYLKLLRHIEPVDVKDQKTKFICQICDEKGKSIKQSEESSDSDEARTDTRSDISYNEDIRLFEIGEEFINERQIEKYQNENNFLKSEIKNLKEEIVNLESDVKWYRNNDQSNWIKCNKLLNDLELVRENEKKLLEKLNNYCRVVNFHTPNLADRLVPPFRKRRNSF